MLRLKILKKCEESLLNIEKIKTSCQLHPIIENMFNPLVTRIRRICEICSVDKYTLYFIGAVGVGKTTAIANLLRLVKRDEIKKDSLLDDILLLKTAEGRTTVCEKEIRYRDDNTSKIEIEATTEEDFKLLIKDFCVSIFMS